MPALLPIRKSETIRLVSPTDTAIDIDATCATKAGAEYWDQYRRGEIADPSKLKFRGNERPHWFIVRALGAREKERADLIKFDRLGTSKDKQTLGSIVAALTAFYERCCSMGLVAVEEETDGGTEIVDLGPMTSEYGFRVWSYEALDRMPRDAVQWLGKQIERLSTLDPTESGFVG